MPVRTSIAKWEGALKDGHGTMSLGSGAFEGQYSFSSRFEEGTGTNPEELIGAAHAGCFSMALAYTLAQAGHEPRRVETAARVHLEQVDGAPVITRIELLNRGRGRRNRRRRVPAPRRVSQVRLHGLEGPRRGGDLAAGTSPRGHGPACQHRLVPGRPLRGGVASTDRG